MIFHPLIDAPRVDAATDPIVIPFAAVLDASAPGIVWCAALGLKSASTTTTLYLSDLGYTSSGSETPADTGFDARLVQPITYRRSVSGRRVGGAALFRGGEMVFAAADQAVEIGGSSYTRRELLDTWSVSGQPVTVKAIPSGYTWDSGVTVFKGKASRWDQIEGGEIRVTLSGTSADIETPLMPATYGGTGGLDGTADLEGKRKPMAFGGTLYNVEPVAVLPGELVYDLHCDRSGSGAPINSVTAVKVGGVPLNFDADYASTALLRAASIGSGEYGTCLAEGRVRLGSTPGAIVTVDLTGATFSGTHHKTPGALLKAVLKAYDPQLSDSDFDTAALQTVDSTRGYTISRWVSPDESLTGAGLLSEISNSVEGSWGDTPSGKLTMTLTQRPSGVAAVSFTSGDIVEGSWEHDELPLDVSPAVKEITVNFRTNYKPLSDIGTAVTGDERTALQQTSRSTTGTQTLALYPDAKVLTVDTLIDNETDAADLRDTILALYDGTLRLARFDGAHRALTQRIGGKCALDFAEEGFSEETVRVLGVDADAEQMQFTVQVMY